MAALTGRWNYPNSIIAGVGRISELAELCVAQNVTNPLIVTDPGLAQLPMLGCISAQLVTAGIPNRIFSEIQANPNEICIERGCEAFKSGSHDGVIALGGGSALDAGKAIALMVGQDRSIWDFEDIGDNWQRVNQDTMQAVIAVPTTAGTGSEVGRASVITDSQALVKKIIFHPKMLPSAVVLDPELTYSLPAPITAATGLDALSHCLEALCSPFYHPMAEGIAIEGVRLIKENLPAAYLNGQDSDARMQMLVASSMGATAFQKGLGAMHAVAHSLGAVYGAHHGLLNAVLMPYVLKANITTIGEKLSRLSTYLELPDVSAEGFIDWIVSFRAQLEIPHTLRDIGLPEDEIPRIAAMSHGDAAASGNPINFTVEEYQVLIANAFSGQFEVLHG